MTTSSEDPPKLCTVPFFYRQWEVIRDPSRFINSLIKKFGDFIYYRGVINFYLINNASLIKKVLNETHRNFDKNTVIYNRFRNAFGNGLVTAEGSHWRRQRKLIQPSFRPKLIEGFSQIMLSSSNRTIDRWSKFCESKTTFNLTEEMNMLTLEIAGKSLLSDGFTRAAKDIIRWTHVINKYSAGIPFPIINKKWFPSPLNFKLRRALKEYRSFISKTIEARKGNDQGEDLLSVFLSMRDEETGQRMEEDEIAEEVLGVIVGGQETSATALVWTLYELSLNAEVEEKLLNEITNVTSGEQMDFSKIGELKYLKMVIQESMRLHPPFWFENRNAMHDVELGGVRIKKGSMIAISRYALHRNTDYWDDPETFNPDRFDEESSRENSRVDSFAYQPFSSGPRVCIGRHFAMMEMTIILCSMLQRYKFRVDPHYKHKVATNLTMEPKGGLPVILERR
ncbi:MAG: cytochrome P450 [Akkermansiaceae bacterium]|jgi:cytochrome P450|nr:cytochrome P450 [Akkermansiaceae bacterium]MDG1853277.1 cytochrome P450 [Verrucomicrobiales bacterium]